MSIEALWWFETPDMVTPGPPLSSVVVVESGRLLGGDSVLAIVGDYEVRNGIITGKARSFQYNPHVTARNVFNMQTPIDYIAGFEVVIGDDPQIMRGHVWPLQAPHLRLPLTMRRIAELP